MKLGQNFVKYFVRFLGNGVSRKKCFWDLLTLNFFQLGINAAFDEGEFTNIIEDNPLKVSQIKHRATIEVTKDGTVGTAASSIELVGLSAALDVPKNININKPFLFFVRDKELKAILFAGKFSNPPDPEAAESE
jgi:serine protease inhibitor